MFVSKENLILMHFVSCPSASPQIHALVHQFFQLLKSGGTSFRITVPFCRGKPSNGFAVTSDQNVMTFLCFAQQTRELLIGFPSSDRAHISSLQQCHYSSAFYRPGQPAWG